MIDDNPSQNGFDRSVLRERGLVLNVWNCGIYTSQSRGVARGVAQRITEAMSHRGPDQQGVFEGSEATLCAVRLKIIDLGGGDQPIVSDDRRYRDRVQRRDLQSSRNPSGTGRRWGIASDRNCDTETVLRAFLQWDTACFSRLRGMFAVALWTESQKRLVLVRDRMGIKPLYYYRSGDDLYFGSELKAILEHPEVPRHLDLEALDTYLSLNYVPGPQTLIEGIRKVPPGHLLEWRSGQIRSEAWWKLPARARGEDLAGCGEGRTGRAAARFGARAPGFGRAAGRVGVGRAGFVDDPALCGGADGGTAEDIFGFVPGTQLRREPVLPGDRARCTARTITSSI